MHPSIRMGKQRLLWQLNIAIIIKRNTIIVVIINNGKREAMGVFESMSYFLTHPFLA
jgi:hypothetical protein